MKSWSASELATFLKVINEHRFHVAFHLASMTGMRRGEVLGLRWQDIDFGASRLAVRQSLVSVAYEIKLSSPKSHQARTIDLDRETMQLLIVHKEAQREEATSWGLGYQVSDLVFRSADGSPIHPDSFSQAFEVVVRNSRLPRIRLHDLRHTHASLALSAGVPVKVISERLGHESPAFTLKQYAHVIPGMQAEAASLVASIVKNSVVVRENDQ